jgi:hypothetical protein
MTEPLTTLESGQAIGLGGYGLASLRDHQDAISHTTTASRSPDRDAG